MRALLKRIIESSTFLPSLPGTYLTNVDKMITNSRKDGPRYLFTQIYLSKDAPKDYEIPAGFNFANVSLRVPEEQDGWKQAKLSLGSVGSNYHS
jgi:hypothetical protein